MSDKMSDFMTRMHAKYLLSALEGAGHVTPEERRTLGKTIAARGKEEDLPVYLRVLVGLGATIASLCLIGFLAITKVIDFDSTVEMVTCGVLFIANAIVLARLAARRGVIGHGFLMQTSFCSVAVGKILFMCGVTVHTGHHDELWTATLALMTVTAVTWPFYRMAVDRFVSAAGVLLMVLANILTNQEVAPIREFLLDGFIAAQLAAAALLFTHGRVTRDARPAGYAIVASLCATVIVLTMNDHFLRIFGSDSTSQVFLNGALSVTLIGLIGWASGNMRRLMTEPLLIAAGGAALLGALSAPGIILAVILMVLGYARHERLLVTTGAALMPVFLCFYYYNLDLTLMAKAGVLVFSGLLLLAGRVYMSAQELDKDHHDKEVIL